MRVLRRSVGFAVTPQEAYTALFGTSTDSVWLDSGAAASEGMSFVGAGVPLASTDPFAALRSMAPVDEPSAPLGWIGWLGYELRAQTMPSTVTFASRYPDHGLLMVDRGVLFDHTTGKVEL